MADRGLTSGPINLNHRFLLFKL